MNVHEFWLQAKSFIKECSRVLRITRKPTSSEYKTIVKVAGLGIIIIGLIGGIIMIVSQMVGI